MNGQFLMNKNITVQYAFKKDGKGERHGTPAERLLAAQARKNNALPVAARPPPAPGMFGAARPGFPGPYQPGQFAGALAQPPPPPGFTPQQTIVPGAPPAGFAPQQTIVPGASGFQPMPPMGMAMMPPGMPGGMPMGMPPPPPGNMPVFNPQAGFPPPPPGFNPGMQGMPGMMPPPPQFAQ
jgi:splicing factor 3B subunit 4